MGYRTVRTHRLGGIASRALNRLTELQIQSFVRQRRKGTPGLQKLADGGGLYLTVSPAGTCLWRIKYRYGGKERLYAAGTYPQVTLSDARGQRDMVKRLLREGRDPVQARRLDRANAVASSGQTFESVAQDWLSMRQAEWSAIHYEKSKRAFERDVFPLIGKLPVRDITPKMVTTVVERVLERGVRDTAVKILQHVNGVFKLAQARGLREDNPAAPVVEVLPPRSSPGRMPALLTWPELGDVLRRAEAAHLSPAVRMAHRLIAYTVARVSNVVQAEWAEFRLDAEVPVWIIPRAKMKSRDRHHDHKIALCPAIVDELRQWRSLSGEAGFLFPSPQGGKHISRESLEKAYRVTLGLANQHSPHGWRSSFSTLARDEGFDREVVELTLDHVHDNDVARAYDRGERLQQRVRLMRWWGEHLTAAQAGTAAVLRQNQAAYRVLRRLPLHPPSKPPIKAAAGRSTLA